MASRLATCPGRHRCPRPVRAHAVAPRGFATWRRIRYRPWQGPSASSVRNSVCKGYAEELFLELVEPIAQVSRSFELQIPRCIEHLFFDALELFFQILLRHGLVLGARLRRLELFALLVDVVDTVDDVLDALGHAYRRDTHLFVPGELPVSTPRRLVDRPLHRVGHLVGVED